MVKRMLIDAAHPEETRVAVLSGKKIDEFDFESAAKKPLKGNIYLAKVTRVEPSLQAAFVDYGGNRHGFLAFNEIHPDYYRIPAEDRQALLEQEAQAATENADGDDPDKPAGDNHEDIDSVDAEDHIDEAMRRRRQLIRRYKIQEVIKRRQVLLVQVVKEERGNKGAALTTYLSLPGRYCVLMPNSPRGGGISRKINNGKDRKRLRGILNDLSLPNGMSVIIRTAGIARTKAEIKRDFTYLTRLWDDIRNRTLESIAPSLIHEEANLIKRAIRDMYDRDIEEVLVEGAEGYKTAKQFMKLLTPSHARRVKEYSDSIPLFQRYQVENQLDAMLSPTVQLPSGGYIVINPTEALVSIDVNSGRATREASIEKTALATNMEAAEEIARQLRLRDMAGLIVVDFIDMIENRNNRAVEKKFKDCLKVDRARLQVGRISHFGLLEMSRQRMHPGVLESSTITCPTCEGAGLVRSTESTALHVLRTVEEEGLRSRSAKVSMRVVSPVAFYLLNNKRTALQNLEERYGFELEILADDSVSISSYEMERDSLPGGQQQLARDEETDKPSSKSDEKSETEDGPKKSSRRRGKRGGRRRKQEAGQSKEPASYKKPAEEKSGEADQGKAAPAESESGKAKPKSKQSRSRSGAARKSPSSKKSGTHQAAETQSEPKSGTKADKPKKGSRRRSGTPASESGQATTAPVTASASTEQKDGNSGGSKNESKAQAEPKTQEKAGATADKAEPKTQRKADADKAEPKKVDEGSTDKKTKRRGWWQRSA